MRRIKDDYRTSGIGAIGDIPWNTHLCCIYNRPADLLELVPAYLAAGLEKNEYCLWALPDEIEVEAARQVLDLHTSLANQAIRQGRLLIINARESYTRGKAFEPLLILGEWQRMLDQAEQDGYAGLRVSGDAGWAQAGELGLFLEYERLVGSLAGFKLLALCSYDASRLSIEEAIDISGLHHYTLLKKKGLWKAVQRPEWEKAQGRIKDLEKKSLHILQSIPDGFILLDEKSRFIYANEKALKLLGPWEGELSKLSYHDLPPGEHSNYYEQYVNALAASTDGSIRLEVFSETLGQWFEISGHHSPHGISVMVRDITDHRKAVKALTQSEERFYKAFHGSPVMMIIVRAIDGVILDINQTALTMMGYNREECLGKILHQASIWPDRSLGERIKDQVLRDGRLSNFEVALHNQQGELLRGLVSVECIDLDDEPCYLAAVNNITDLVSLQRKMDRLDRLHLVGEMAASIGHEVRNPMTTVRGFLQMLREIQPGMLEVDVIDLMIEELDRANSILSEYLTLASNKARSHKLVQLNDIIRSLSPLIAAEAVHNEKMLVLNLEPLPPQMLDEKEIRQLLLNLVRNGLEAMEPGSTLRINTYLSRQYVVLSVRDEGHGILPELLNKLGTPFFTTKEQGVGLGLAVCYSIASRHNASIVIESNPRGTTFLVKFPLPLGADSLSLETTS